MGDGGDTAAAIFGCLSCCRMSLILCLFIVACVLASLVSGKDYVQQEGGGQCRMVRFDESIEIQPVPLESIGGGDIYSVEAELDFLPCAAEDEDLACNDMDPLACDCENNPWATQLKLIDLPRYCRNVDGSQIATFVDADDKVSGFLFILPICIWLILKMTMIGLEVAHTFADEKAGCCAAIFGSIALGLAPNVLFRTAIDARLALTVSGVGFFSQGTMMHALSALGVFYACTVAVFAGLDLSGEDDVKKKGASGFCVFACAVPFVILEMVAVMRNGIFFGITFDFSLPWPELQFTQVLSAIRVLLFLVSCLDIIQVPLSILKHMMKMK